MTAEVSSPAEAAKGTAEVSSPAEAASNTARAVLIGIGNEYRQDDGIGPRLITELNRHDLPGVRLVVSDGEPAGLLADWADMEMAIIVDTVRCEPAHPGRIHRTSLDELRPPAGDTSSHGLGIPEAVALARVLDQLPARLVVFAVEAADISLGIGLSTQVEAAIPALRDAVLAELATVHTQGGTTANPSRPCPGCEIGGQGPSEWGPQPLT